MFTGREWTEFSACAIDFLLCSALICIHYKFIVIWISVRQFHVSYNLYSDNFIYLKKCGCLIPTFFALMTKRARLKLCVMITPKSWTEVREWSVTEIYPRPESTLSGVMTILQSMNTNTERKLRENRVSLPFRFPPVPKFIPFSPHSSSD